MAILRVNRIISWVWYAISSGRSSGSGLSQPDAEIARAAGQSYKDSGLWYPYSASSTGR